MTAAVDHAFELPENRRGYVALDVLETAKDPALVEALAGYRLWTNKRTAGSIGAFVGAPIGKLHDWRAGARFEVRF